MKIITSKTAKKLLEKYLEGGTSLIEEKYLINFFQSKEVPEELESFKVEFSYYKKYAVKPSNAFMKRIQNQLQHQRPKTFIYKLNNLAKIAAVLLLMISSFFSGKYLSDENRTNKLTRGELQKEIYDLKNITVNTMLEASSSHRRIEGLVLANELDSPPDKLLLEVVEILNRDKSPLVRGVALEFIKNHKERDVIKSILIESLEYQDLLPLQLDLIRMINELNSDSLLKQLEELTNKKSFDDELLKEIKKI